MRLWVVGRDGRRARNEDRKLMRLMSSEWSELRLCAAFCQDRKLGEPLVSFKIYFLTWKMYHHIDSQAETSMIVRENDKVKYELCGCHEHDYYCDTMSTWSRWTPRPPF